MFWIAYIFAMLFNFYRIGSIDTSIGKWRYIFSILGIDGYIANWGVQTFFSGGRVVFGVYNYYIYYFPDIEKGR